MTIVIDPERFAHRLAAANREIAKLRAALEAIESLMDEEIAVRFRTSSHKTEEQMAGKSVIYDLLVVPRNIARAALQGRGRG